MSTSKHLTIDQIINGVLRREGGFVDHSDDLGGPTKFGITAGVAMASGCTRDVRSLSVRDARKIYKEQYYCRPGFDRVAKHSPCIASELVDTGVNMGVVTAARFLQRALNALNKRASIYSDIEVDGYIGNKTIAALSAYFNHRGAEGEEVMLKALNCLQGARYIELSEAREANESFTYGWLRERIAI